MKMVMEMEMKGEMEIEILSNPNLVEKRKEMKEQKAGGMVSWRWIYDGYMKMVMEMDMKREMEMEIEMEMEMMSNTNLVERRKEMKEYKDGGLVSWRWRW